MKGDDEILHHFMQLALWPCMACGLEGVELHHCFGGSMSLRGIRKPLGGKVSDWLVAPLCPTCHRFERGIHRVGIPTWEKAYGQQAVMLDRICETLSVDVWRLSGEKHVKPYRRSHKIVPRTAA